jgi:plasmid maintenance system killer protein
MILIKMVDNSEFEMKDSVVKELVAKHHVVAIQSKYESDLREQLKAVETGEEKEALESLLEVPALEAKRAAFLGDLQESYTDFAVFKKDLLLVPWTKLTRMATQVTHGRLNYGEIFPLSEVVMK